MIHNNRRGLCVGYLKFLVEVILLAVLYSTTSMVPMAWIYIKNTTFQMFDWKDLLRRATCDTVPNRPDMSTIQSTRLCHSKIFYRRDGYISPLWLARTTHCESHPIRSPPPTSATAITTTTELSSKRPNAVNDIHPPPPNDVSESCSSCLLVGVTTCWGLSLYVWKIAFLELPEKMSTLVTKQETQVVVRHQQFLIAMGGVFAIAGAYRLYLGDELV
jgi:hypothetical protein